MLVHVAVGVCNRGVGHGGDEQGMPVAIDANDIARLQIRKAICFRPGFHGGAVVVIAELIGIAHALDGVVKGVAAAAAVVIAVAVQMPAGRCGIPVGIVVAAVMVPVCSVGEFLAQVGERHAQVCSLGLREGQQRREE